MRHDANSNPTLVTNDSLNVLTYHKGIINQKKDSKTPVRLAPAQGYSQQSSLSSNSGI